MAASKRRSGILLIAIYKLVKGLALLAVGFGLLRLLHRDVEITVRHWIEILRVDPDSQYLHRILVKIFAITPKQMKELSAGTFLYAGLFLTEGTGLVLRKRWAEYMTVVTTALLIPLELYEIWRHVTAVRIAVLAINVATVWYLIKQIRR